jgi:hypothetical protein
VTGQTGDGRSRYHIRVAVPALQLLPNETETKYFMSFRLTRDPDAIFILNK